MTGAGTLAPKVKPTGLILTEAAVSGGTLRSADSLVRELQHSNPGLITNMQKTFTAHSFIRVHS